MDSGHNIILNNDLKTFKASTKKKGGDFSNTSSHQMKKKSDYEAKSSLLLLTIKPCFLSVNLLQYHLLASDLTGNHHIFSKI